MKCRTVTLIIEFKLLNRMEKIYRLYSLIHYGEFESIYRKNRYIEIFNISKFSILKWTIRYDTIYQYRNDISIFSIYRPTSKTRQSRLGLPLSSIFRIEYSFEYLSEYSSTRLNQKRGGVWMCKLGVVSQERLKIEVNLLVFFIAKLINRY